MALRDVYYFTGSKNDPVFGHNQTLPCGMLPVWWWRWCPAVPWSRAAIRLCIGHNCHNQSSGDRDAYNMQTPVEGCQGQKDMLWLSQCTNICLLLSLFRPFLSDFYHYLLELDYWEMRLAIFNLPFLLTPQFFSCTPEFLVPTPDTGQIDG